MIKKINVILVLSLLLLVSIGSVSAIDDDNATVSSSDEAILETSDVEEIVSSVEESEIISDSSDDVLSSNSVTVDNNNYLSYFDKDGNARYTINSGDTVKLNDSFSNVNFTFNKKVNVEGLPSSSLNGCTVKLLSGASGSSVSNLIIRNTAQYAQGVRLDGADDCIIKNCFINNTGPSAYCICLGNDANNNKIIDNHLYTYGETYGHNTRSTPPLVLFGSHYNYIANNVLECDDTNAIYFSSYGGGPFRGAESHYNTVFNNSVKYNVLPTSWSYGIQVMGCNNTIDSNTIIGAYRGVSTSTSGFGGNNITNNRIVNLVGCDFSTGKASGGECAIVATYNSIVRNNRIENASIMASGSGISVLDNSIVENNYVEVVRNAGKGINAHGSHIQIRNNAIFTVSGAVIFQQGGPVGLIVENNNITSKTGIGILFKKQSNKVMPSNVTVRNNIIHTKAKYIIDASEVNADSSYVIENNFYGKVLDPSGSYDFSRPVYKFDGAVHNITPENYENFIDDNGNFMSDMINDSDILNFIGSFSNKEIKINQPVKITGNNPIFYNSTFNIISGGVWIENLTIINEKSRINNWGIVINKVEDGAIIRNNNISVYDLKSAYAIYIIGSGYIDVINNTLFSSGDFLTYTLLAYSVSDCRFINNTVNTLGTGEVYQYTNEYCFDGEWVCIDGQWYAMEGQQVCIDGAWYALEGNQVNINGTSYPLEDQKVCIDGEWYCLDGQQVCIDGQQVCLDGQNVCLDGQNVCLDGENVCLDGQQVSIGGSCVDGSHIVPELQRTYGILMLYSSGNQISRNKVNVSSKLNQTLPNIGNKSSQNSIIGIDLYYNSHDNVFSENEVFVKGNDNYIYGMGVLGYYTGHNAPEWEGATNNQFIDNKITIEGTYFATGLIVGDESRDTVIKNNVVDIKSTNVTYGVTLEMSHESIIENNHITLNSDLIYGLEAFQSNGNVISSNDFKLNGKKIYGMALNSKNNVISHNNLVANSSGETLTFKELDSINGENAGIYLADDASYNLIEDNNITALKGYAVNLDDFTNNNTIVFNYLISEMGTSNNAVNASEGNNVSGNYIHMIEGSLSKVQVPFLGEGEFIFNAEGAEGANVEFYIGDYYLGSSQVINGKASVIYRLDEDFTPATYLIQAFATLEEYKSLNNFSQLTVTKGNLNVEVTNISVKDGLNGIFTAKITNAMGNPIPNLQVRFYRGSQIIGSADTDENGVATKVILVPKSLTGSFVIKAKTDDSDYYSSSEGFGNLTILDVAPVTIEVDNSLCPGGVLATLTDNNGFGVDSKVISIKIGSASYSLKTNSKGQIILPKVNAGKYNLDIIFNNDGVFDSFNYNGKITVLSLISGNKNFNVFYGTTVQYKVKAVLPNGDVGANKIVAIKVNGKTYNVKTDKNGFAVKSIKLGVGKYTISAQYNGYKVSNKITVKATLIAKNIVMKKAKKIKFSAKLVDKNGKILKNKKVTFKINGKKYVAKTNKKGVATAVIKNLKVGKHSIISSYGGCNIKNTIKIKK